MYRKDNPHQLTFENFYLPFGGRLRSDNRWVILAAQIPWDQIEDAYGELFSEDNGCPAKSARMALGALLIKERLNLSDRETVEQITENPYLQSFLGLMEYQDEPPFDPSMMTHFRKRFDKDILAEINESIVQKALTEADSSDVSKVHDADNRSDGDNNDTPANKGKLIVDATCTPADIAYPTDLSLVNEAREKAKKSLTSCTRFIGIRPKPRTYRQKLGRHIWPLPAEEARNQEDCKAIGQQLRYLKRNLGTIDRMAEEGLLVYLGKRLYRLLLVIKEVYRQQLYMYETRTHSISDRIVSLYQPHVRPIVRGKAKSPVEFGAKVSISLVDGFSFVEKIGWDAYNESCDLIEQIKQYRKRWTLSRIGACG